MILGSYAFLEKKKKRISLFSFLFCRSLIYFFTLGFCFSFCSLKGEGGGELADRPNHPLSREEWRLETKHFLGMASICTRGEKDV